jgi:hypothetical protein
MLLVLSLGVITSLSLGQLYLVADTYTVVMLFFDSSFIIAIVKEFGKTI